MGIRFYRRVKICKGLYLNFSKSGVGISLGGRGASLSIGPRGVYSNFGIPGTGLSFREKLNKKIESSQPTKIEYSDDNGNAPIVSKSTSSIKINFGIAPDGKESFSLIDSNGNTITDENLIRKVKRQPKVKDIIAKTRIYQHERICENNEKIVSIYKLTPKTISENDVKEELKDTSCVERQYYSPKIYYEKKPEFSSYFAKAKQYAVSSVKTWKFWKKRKLINEVTEEKQNELYQIDLKEWEKRKTAFLEQEEKIKIEKEIEYNKEFEGKVAEREKLYAKILDPDEQYLQETVNDVLSQIELPVDFFVDYAININDKKIELDIDLPEIEDYPDQVSSILSDGKLSVKKKTNINFQKDYATSVIGIAFFFAGVMFNISPAIEIVSVSGYTQRLNSKTGNIEDQYVYSIDFNRKKFAKMTISRIDPLEAISNFNHIIDLTNKYELKTINIFNISKIEN